MVSYPWPTEISRVQKNFLFTFLTAGLGLNVIWRQGTCPCCFKALGHHRSDFHKPSAWRCSSLAICWWQSVCIWLVQSSLGICRYWWHLLRNSPVASACSWGCSPQSNPTAPIGEHQQELNKLLVVSALGRASWSIWWHKEGWAPLSGQQGVTRREEKTSGCYIKCTSVQSLEW